MGTEVVFCTFHVTVTGETYLQMLRTFHVSIFLDIPFTQMKTTLFKKIVCYITSSKLCMMSLMSHFKISGFSVPWGATFVHE